MLTELTNRATTIIKKIWKEVEMTNLIEIYRKTNIDEKAFLKLISSSNSIWTKTKNAGMFEDQFGNIVEFSSTSEYVVSNRLRNPSGTRSRVHMRITIKDDNHQNFVTHQFGVVLGEDEIAREKTKKNEMKAIRWALKNMNIELPEYGFNFR